MGGASDMIICYTLVFEKKNLTVLKLSGMQLKAKRQKKMPNEKKAKSKSRSRLVHLS
jgi:hypothetical protein